MTPKNREEAIRIVVNAAADHLTGLTGLDLFQILDAAGLAIVPKEPTEAMTESAFNRAFEPATPGVQWGPNQAYRAMLDASPFKDES